MSVEKFTPVQQAASVFRVAVDSAAAAVRGDTVTLNDRLASQRLRECQSCPQLQGATCGICGCMVNFKTRVKAASCPIGKW